MQSSSNDPDNLSKQPVGGRNWRKMLWRLWIFFSVPWVLGFGATAVISDASGELLYFGLMALLVPLGFLALGRSLIWVIDGLKE